MDCNSLEKGVLKTKLFEVENLYLATAKPHGASVMLYSSYFTGDGNQEFREVWIERFHWQKFTEHFDIGRLVHRFV